MRLIDITGQRFSLLTVLSRDGINKHGQTMWRCSCDCGEVVRVAGFNLKNGNTRSCGCLKPMHRTHGKGHSRVYQVWRNMRARCYDPKTARYPKYGGRGITVCERWQIFENFYADMGDPPVGMSIDRIDNDGNYEPGNCRWATLIEQANKKTTTRMVIVDGTKLPLKIACRQLGLDPRRIYDRLRYRFGNGPWYLDREIKRLSGVKP